ncbi:MAG: hypothetical protein ABH871_04730 [Pseudomonadota bacterium]
MGDVSLVVGGVTLLTVLLTVGAFAAIGHKVKNTGMDFSSSRMLWALSGLILFERWLQEKLIACCTLGMPSEPNAVKEISIPKPIQTMAYLTTIHESIIRKGWQPYKDLSALERFRVLMQFVKGEKADAVSEIEVLKLPLAVLKFKHKDGREAQLKLNELSTFASMGLPNSLKIFSELFDLQISDEWYAKWTEKLSKKDLSELSVRIANGEMFFEIADDDIASVSVEHEWSFVRLRHKYNSLDFDPALRGSPNVEARLLENYDRLLDRLDRMGDKSPEEKGYMAKMYFAHMAIGLLNGKSKDADPLVLDAAQLQVLININPEFFETVQWKDMPRQVREARRMQ